MARPAPGLSYDPPPHVMTAIRRQVFREAAIVLAVFTALAGLGCLFG